MKVLMLIEAFWFGFIERLAWFATMICMAFVGLVSPQTLMRELREFDREYESLQEELEG